jgi:hypothetical protein
MSCNSADARSHSAPLARFRGGMAAVILVTAVMFCSADGAEVATEVASDADVESEAVALLHVRKEDSESQDAYERYRRMQLRLIESPFILTAALRRPGITNREVLRTQKDPVGWLRERIHASAPADSEVVQIRMRGAHPHVLQQIVTAVAQTYLNDARTTEKFRRFARHDRLQSEYSENIAKLKALREDTDVPENAHGDLHERRNAIQQLQAITNQQALALDESARGFDAPSRVDLVEEVCVRSVRRSPDHRSEDGEPSDAAASP